MILFSEKKYLINGKELGAEDFDEDPTEIIDGEVKSDEKWWNGTNTNAFPFPFRSLIN